MPRNRIPKPSDEYYLERDDYLMTVHFCLAYNNNKRRLQTLGGVRAQALDGMPHGTDVSDPTQREALIRAWLQGKVDLVEHSVAEATNGIPVLYQPLLLAVTERKMTIDQIMARYRVPMGKKQFLRMRRRVYFLVHRGIDAVR